MVSQGKVDVFYVSLDSLTSTNGMAHSPLRALQICAGDRPIEQDKHCLSKVINYSVIILDDVQDIILANENTFLKFLECMALSVPRVKLIIMSCQVMDYLFVDMVPVLLDSLSLVDVKEVITRCSRFRTIGGRSRTVSPSLRRSAGSPAYHSCCVSKRKFYQNPQKYVPNKSSFNAEVIQPFKTVL